MRARCLFELAVCIKKSDPVKTRDSCSQRDSGVSGGAGSQLSRPPARPHPGRRPAGPSHPRVKRQIGPDIGIHTNSCCCPQIPSLRLSEAAKGFVNIFLLPLLTTILTQREPRWSRRRRAENCQLREKALWYPVPVPSCNLSGDEKH